tara:strand:+ start:7985 stop:8926 length:942 start_codon:yes stop_codon:yes gene_type:complete
LGNNEAGPRYTEATSWNKTAASNRGWPVWKGSFVIARISGALARGILVALLVATPALMLPDVITDSSQITMLVALLACFLTFIEYNSNFPSIIEFREAAPFNRLRFTSLAATVLVLTMILQGKTDPTAMTGALTSIGTIIGNAMDFPYSPVRMIVLMLPENSDQGLIASVRTSAGMAYLISLVSMAAFLILVRAMNWPARKGAFNVWVNLPLFDPTAGGDVIYRLQRDARINIALGFLLPFLIPAVVKAAADLIDPITLQNPQTQIWTVAAWAFLPASIIMRGIAMGKIADMIEEKRRRAYAADTNEQAFQPA